MQGVWNKERKCRFCILSRAVSDSEHGYLGFVNAQYRFVMNPHGDYTVHFADPDMYVISLSYLGTNADQSLATSNGRISSKSSFPVQYT